MKIAAETKDEENSLDGSARNSILTLVPRSGNPSPNRAFRIGVSDDVFERREKSREKPLDSIKRSIADWSEKDPQNEKHESKATLRFEPVIVFAAAGLVLGYLLGRHSRK